MAKALYDITVNCLNSLFFPTGLWKLWIWSIFIILVNVALNLEFFIIFYYYLRTEDDFLSLESYERSVSFWDEFCMLLLPWENKFRIQFEKQQKLPRVPQGRNLPEDATYLLLKGEHREGFKGRRLQEEKKYIKWVSTEIKRDAEGGKKQTLLWFIIFFSAAAVFQKIEQPEWKQESRIVWSAARLFWCQLRNFVHTNQLMLNGFFIEGD